MAFNSRFLVLLNCLALVLRIDAHATTFAGPRLALEGLQPIRSESQQEFDGVFYAEHQVTVNLTELGLTINGYRQNLTNVPPTKDEWKTNAAVEVFLGIPYAEPPVGSLRFEAPREKVHRRDELLNATTYGSACPQPAYLYSALTFNESCLFLNIFKPSTINAHVPLYPVMIFIHGGDYTYGASDLYPGHLLAYSQKVVVITFNYRLGAFGFMATTAADNIGGGLRANYGMLDQRLAMRWVKKYIQHFHGDPNQVMLFGHGSGAACVGMHLMYNTTSLDRENLFQRAITQSGSELAPWAVIRSWDTAYENTLELANKTGCLPAANAANAQELMMKCMRNRDARQIVDAAARPDFKPAESTVLPWAPVVCTDVSRCDEAYNILRDQPRTLMNTRIAMLRANATADVPLMTGVTAQDGVKFITHNNRDESDPQMTRDNFAVAVQAMVPNLSYNNLNPAQQQQQQQATVEQQSRIITEYYSPQLSDEDQKVGNEQLSLRVLENLYTDAYFVGPMNLALQLRTRDTQQNPQPVYQYVFNGLPQYSRHYHPAKWQRTANAADLWFVFGFPFLNNCSDVKNVPYGVTNKLYGNELTLSWEQDKNLSEFMMQMWRNFARTSNPTSSNINNRFNVTWQPYTNERQAYLDISTAQPSISNRFSGATSYHHLSGNFWMHVLPQIFKPMPISPDYFQFIHRWQVATWVLTATSALLLLALLGTIISYYRFRHSVKRGYWGGAR